MDHRWQLRMDCDGRPYVAQLTGRADIGRQANVAETQPSHQLTQNGWRVVVAPHADTSVSRHHVQIEPLEDERFLLVNTSGKLIVGLPNHRCLEPKGSCKILLPVTLRLGRLELRRAPGGEGPALRMLPLATPAPGDDPLSPRMNETLETAVGQAMQADHLMAWINAFVGLLRSAAGSEDFYQQAATALVDLIKLDSGRVLFRIDGCWQEKALRRGCVRKTPGAWRPSRRILNHLVREKKTCWQVPDMGSSTWGLDAVVAAPILDRRGAVIGALYGERRWDDEETQEPITLLEAMLVEVLASGVAAGLARLEQEHVALRTRLQMEQFFTPRLAARLADRPELLLGRDAEVSVLFCDIVGFSGITEKLGAARTVELVADVMGVVTQCVLDQEGVVVDYAGDSVMAMWGAPEDQPDHACRACHAALAMLASLPELNQRWRPILCESLALGIGISSGSAHVGNVGSKIKLKYGALGNTVNLASRVQGATKYLGTPLLITDATRTRLSPRFATRELCQVRAVNITQPVALFELAVPGQANWLGLKRAYEAAAHEFTQGNFQQACDLLDCLLQTHPDDGPARVLRGRAGALMSGRPTTFEPVLVLPGK